MHRSEDVDVQRERVNDQCHGLVKKNRRFFFWGSRLHMQAQSPPGTSSAKHRDIVSVADGFFNRGTHLQGSSVWRS